MIHRIDERAHRMCRGLLSTGAAAMILALAGGCGGSGKRLTDIQLSPATVSVAKGLTQQLTASGTWSDGTKQDVTAQVAWSSSAPAVASVSAAGLVKGEGMGSAAVTASLGAISGAATVTVSPPVLTAIAVAPGSGNVLRGQSLQLVAAGTYSDATSGDVTGLATWTSGSPATISVSATGLAAALPATLLGRTAVITAAIGTLSGTSTLTVAAPAIGPGVDNDPMLGQQWHLKNTGQNGYADTGGIAGNDIATAATYQLGISGSGVKAAVVDTGLEIAHEDLAANVVPGSWDFVNNDNDPTSTATTGDHGTSVAGLIAAVRNNGKGGMGVAPGAGLNGYNFLVSTQTTPILVASLGGSSSNPTSNDVWVFNQSYGFSNLNDFPVNATEEAQYLSGVTTLRGGKGALYVKAAGNGFRSIVQSPDTCAPARALGTSCQNASMDPYNTLPFNVVVGAVNAGGVKSSYSTAGSAIWVSAPGGEYGLNASVAPGLIPEAYQPAMVTTDQSGCAAGYSRTGVNTSVFDDGAPPNTSCNYANTMNGTSSATPVTVGAIALVLEANPALGWRDVKHILASTATQVDPSRAAVIVPVSDPNVALRGYVAELPWITNAAGHKFHNWYGFGRVNVDAAVAMATSYSPGQLGTLADTGWIASGALSLPIPDASATGVTSTITVPATPDLTIEAVQIAVTAAHTYIGDLGIELTSPAGTKTILLNIRNGFNGSGLNGMVLASNAFYGETSAGNWTIKVVDGDAIDTGTLNGWQIRIYGH